MRRKNDEREREGENERERERETTGGGRKREREGESRKGEMETFQRDGTRGIYAVGCRRRVDCEPRSINNDTIASTTETRRHVLRRYIHVIRA